MWAPVLHFYGSMRGRKRTLIHILTVGGMVFSSTLLYGRVITPAIPVPPMPNWSEPASASPASLRTPASQMDDQRLAHAKELLGKYYKHSVVRNGEKVVEIRKFIYEWTKRSLDAKWKTRSRTVARTILRESEKHEFDPIFLMAVIQNESGFNPAARGRFGELGLMQLKPDTAEWVARKSHIHWKNANQLLDPVNNIRIGAAYLSYLRERFDQHGRLYLAAYNMGTTNVNRALEKKIWPKDYPARVMQRYIGFYSELRDAIRKQAQDEVETD